MCITVHFLIYCFIFWNKFMVDKTLGIKNSITFVFIFCKRKFLYLRRCFFWFKQLTFVCEWYKKTPYLTFHDYVFEKIFILISQSGKIFSHCHLSIWFVDVYETICWHTQCMNIIRSLWENSWQLLTDIPTDTTFL